MKSRLGIILLLFVLNFDGVVNNTVGARSAAHGQGQALLLQNNSLSEFLLMSHSPDGVAVTNQRRKRRHRRSRRHRAKVYGVKMTPDEPGAPSPPPPPPAPAQAAAPDAEPMVGGAPPAQASPEMSAPGRVRATPAKKSAPRIKPPTVQIKPPTE